MSLKKHHFLIILALLLLNLGCESTESEDQIPELSTSPYLSATYQSSYMISSTYLYNDDKQRIESRSETQAWPVPILRSIFYNYNDNGQIIEISYSTFSKTSVTYRYSYDNGLISKSTYLSPQGEICGETLYTYNSEGFLITKTNGDNEWRYVYEGSNVVEINLYFLEETPLKDVLLSTTFFEYDEMNNPMQNGLPDEFNKLDRLSDHNVISETEIMYPIGDEFTPPTVIYSYDYNDESYPISQTSSRDYTIIYEYIDL